LSKQIAQIIVMLAWS